MFPATVCVAIEVWLSSFSPSPPLPQALTELTRGDVAVFSCPQRVFSLCERADLLGHVWDLDHTDLEVWGNRRMRVWEYGSMSEWIEV